MERQGGWCERNERKKEMKERKKERNKERKKEKERNEIIIEIFLCFWFRSPFTGAFLNKRCWWMLKLMVSRYKLLVTSVDLCNDPDLFPAANLTVSLPARIFPVVLLFWRHSFLSGFELLKEEIFRDKKKDNQNQTMIIIMIIQRKLAFRLLSSFFLQQFSALISWLIGSHSIFRSMFYKSMIWNIMEKAPVASKSKLMLNWIEICGFENQICAWRVSGGGRRPLLTLPSISINLIEIC